MKRFLLAWSCVFATAGNASAIEIVFDYSLDINNFFNTQAKRDALEAAASVFEVFTDRLDAIVPGTINNEGTPFEFADTWTAQFTHPGTGSEIKHSVTDLTIPADTIRIFVGGYDIPETVVGWADAGSSYSNGSFEFNTAVKTRGQPGVQAWIPNDFGPWGGSISFDTNTYWHYDTQTSPSFSQIDFYSVAIHELGHLLGFGVSQSFKALASGTSFMGPVAASIYGTNPSLDSDKWHWQEGTYSYSLEGGPRETALSPYIDEGLVRAFTFLDFAALDDIGWQVPLTVYGGIEGDLDSDGFVGIADLNIVLGAWNESVTPGDYPSGDPSGDGFVGIDDLDTVLGNWNAGTPPAAAAAPEPTSLVLAGLAAPFLMGRRRCG